MFKRSVGHCRPFDFSINTLQNIWVVEIWSFMASSFSRFFFSSVSSSAAAATRILKIGDTMRRTRKFSHSDVIDYSKLSEDSNPLHLDADCARNSGFNDPIVHGMLVASLFPQIIASHFPGAIYASQSLQFKLPVYVGDEVVAEVQADNLRENKKGCITKFSTRCFKNGELLVIVGEAVAILPTLTMKEEQST